MTSALVLGAGSSWAAYQMGALRHIVWDRDERYDLYAGTGIGAMHAAMVACREFEALEDFWRDIRAWRLLSPNWRSPVSGGPFVGNLQRRFMGAHVSEQRLRGEEVQLLVSTHDLNSGALVVHTYPGADVPLCEGLAAAVATPGLIEPIRFKGRTFAEGTLISNLPLSQALEAGATDVVAIATASAHPSVGRFETWRSVLERALVLNQVQDSEQQIDTARVGAAATEAFAGLRASLPDRLAEEVEDPDLAQRLRAEVAGVLKQSPFPSLPSATRLRVVVPSVELQYPLWRFRRADLAWARALGYRDARMVLSRP